MPVNARLGWTQAEEKWWAEIERRKQGSPPTWIYPPNHRLYRKPAPPPVPKFEVFKDSVALPQYRPVPSAIHPALGLITRPSRKDRRGHTQQATPKYFSVLSLTEGEGYKACPSQIHTQLQNAPHNSETPGHKPAKETVADLLEKQDVGSQFRQPHQIGVDGQTMEKSVSGVKTTKTQDEASIRLDKKQKVAHNAPVAKASTNPTPPSFGRTNKGITYLHEKVLPDFPHLLVVPAGSIIFNNSQYPWESEGTPFDHKELQQKLQYMTLISTYDRGVTITQGDWQEDSSSGGLRSGTTTPRSERDPNKPRVKLSLKEYKATKKTDGKILDPIAEKERLETLAIVEAKKREVARLSKERELEMEAKERAEKLRTEQEARRAKLEQSRERTAPATMAPPKSSDKEFDERRGVNSVAHSTNSKPSASRDMHSASRASNHADSRTSSLPEKPLGKRPYDSHGERTSEKRARIDISSGPKSPGLDTSKSRPSLPPKPPVSTYKGTAAQKHEPSSVKSRPGEIVSKSDKSSKAVDMPRLLSPLPAGLTSPDGDDIPLAQVSHAKKTDGMKAKPNKITLPPQGTREMPPLLSPTLPHEIEQALKRASSSSSSQGSGSHVLNTVEARRERSRYPDAPGVARKLPKGKRPATSREPSVEDRGMESRLVVKLKYRKHMANSIQRILKMRPSPGRGAVADREKEAKAESSKEPHGGSSKVGDKRRQEDGTDSASKRPKPSSLDVPAVRTPIQAPIKSPNLNLTPGTSQRLLATPKKGDAMARVGSSDGQARTPQANSTTNSTPKPGPTSTPASVEKPKVNGTTSQHSALNPNSTGSSSNSSHLTPEIRAEIEAHKLTFSKYVSMGTTIKRKMDSMLRPREGDNPMPKSSEHQKLGAMYGLESVAAYMHAFNAYDAQRRLERAGNGGQNWDQTFALLRFVTERCVKFGPLHALALLEMAMCREWLGAIQNERLGAGDPPAEFTRSVAYNSRHRALAWAQYRQTFKSLDEKEKKMLIGVGGTMDAGVDCGEMVKYLMVVCGEWAKKEGIAWEQTFKI